MAPSLLDLPAELLLKIVEDGSPFWQESAYNALRATCREANGKLVHFFASKYFQKLRPSLTVSHLQCLHGISKNSIGSYVQTVELSVSTLFTHIHVDPDCESTDASRCSWYTEEQLSRVGFMSDQFRFNEEVMDFMADGSCASMLGEALSGLPILKCLTIRPPTVHGRMKAAKLDDIRSRWMLACKVMLSAIFSRETTVQELTFTSGQCYLAVPISALDVTATHATHSVAMSKLCLDLVTDFKESAYPVYTRILANFFKKLPALTHLEIAFNKASAQFFKQLSRAVPSMHLRKLKLSNVVTRYKYLKLFLDSCGYLLSDLTLNRVDFTRSEDHVALYTYFSEELDLKTCVLRELNFGGKGLRFGRLNQLLADDGENRNVALSPQSECELVLSGEQVDDVSSFLIDDMDYIDFGAAWPRVR